MDFKPWRVGSLELRLGLLGLEAMDGIAGSGLEVVEWLGDVVGRPEASFGRGGRGRIDLMLFKRSKATCLGGEEGGALLSEDEFCSVAALKDFTLFERGRNETLPGETRGSFAVFDRASDAFVGVSSEAGRPVLGRGRVDGLDATFPSSFTTARPAETSPNVDFLLFAGSSFSNRLDASV
jgi:hypothetical protein